jgi:hypothetical protein
MMRKVNMRLNLLRRERNVFWKKTLDNYQDNLKDREHLSQARHCEILEQPDKATDPLGPIVKTYVKFVEKNSGS